MIDFENTKRIKQDARIAIDALESIAYDPADVSYESYISEKIEVAESCIKFIKNFIEEYRYENL